MAYIEKVKQTCQFQFDEQLGRFEFDKRGRNMFNEIKTREDIQFFLEKTNSLHDGHIINVQYTNNGISKSENSYCISSEQTKLILQILVTSIWDAVVEIEFENVLEWQINNYFCWDITDTSVMFNEQNWIIWTDDVFVDMEETKKGSYAIAKSMKWRIME